MTYIVPLSHVDPSAVETLLDDAFGADRKSRSAYRMREGTQQIQALSFAALDDAGVLIGSLQSWPVALEAEDGTRTPLTLVGPVAVSPTLQRGGIGKMLMNRLIDAAIEQGHDALMMIGDPEYYGRFFGFFPEATAHWEIPGPVKRSRLLARISRTGGVPSVGRVVPNP
jgi:predicted N-acetyltransferase YhbS